MHCWSLQELIEDLKIDAISHRDAMLYLLGFAIFNFIGLSVFNWLLDLYHLTLNVVKDFLERQAQGAQLFIVRYDTYDMHLMIALLLLITLGIITCWKANSDRRHFIKRFVCLSWVINIRIIFMLTVLYILALFISIALYLPRLAGLSSPKFNPENPIELIAGLIKNFGAMKPIMDKLANLQKATQIFQGINALSIRFYYGAIALTILASIWYFIRMRQAFKHIAQNNRA